MADQVVVADNVELVANNIQEKVGATLLGGRALAEDTRQVSEPTIGILDNIRTFQQATVEKVHHVWEILKSTLDLQKEQARRVRENRGEADLEAGGGEIESTVKKSNLGAQLMDKMKGFGAQLFTLAGLMSIVGLIFKAGLIFMLAGFLGDALVNYFNIESEAAKTALTVGLPAIAAIMALVFPLIGIKGLLLLAIPAIIGMGFASVISWIKGDKVAGEVSGFDWGAVALTGPAIMLLGKYAGLLGAKGLTLAGLAIGWPVLLAGSLAIALAAGIGYLFSKVSQTEQKMLDHLSEMTDISQAEFEDRLEKQKSGFLASIAPGLAKTFGMDTTQLQDTFMATEAAKDKVRAGKDLKDTEVTNLVKQVDMFANIDEDTLKTLLDDKDKADELLKSINNMYQIAQSGKLGEHSGTVIKQLAGLSQNIQQTAKDMYSDKEKQGLTSWGREGYLKDISTDSGSFLEGGGDMFEQYAKMLENPEYQKGLKEKEAIEGDSRYQELLKIKPKDMDKDQMAEWKEFKAREWNANSAMSKVSRKEMEQMGGLHGEVKMLDLLKLLTPEEQTMLLEQALSDKRVLLGAQKHLIGKTDQGTTIMDNKDMSSKVITTSKSSNVFSSSGVFEVDSSIRANLAQNG